MQFTLNARMELTGINPRKEGPDDDKHTAVDLKFCGAVSVSDLLPLIGSEDPAAFAKSLWDTVTELWDVRFPNIETIKPHSSTEFDGLNCNAFSTNIVEARAHKFSFKPHAGGADLTFTLSIPDPEQDILPMAAAALGEDVRLEIEPAQQEMPLGEDTDAG